MFLAASFNLETFVITVFSCAGWCYFRWLTEHCKLMFKIVKNTDSVPFQVELLKEVEDQLSLIPLADQFATIRNSVCNQFRL